METQNVNHVNRFLFTCSSSLSVLVSKNEGSSKSFRVDLVAFLFLISIFLIQSAVFVNVTEFDKF